MRERRCGRTGGAVRRGDHRGAVTPPFVHSSTIVDDGVQIGAGTRIWHFCHLSEGARIGARCTLGQNTFVGRGVRLGDGVKVQNNVSIYEGVEIDDEVFLGPSCVFTNVSIPRAFVDRKADYLPTRVGRGATIGANATVVCGNTIGAHAFIGAGAVVTRDVPAHGLVVGNPGRRVGWACRCGVRLPDAPRPRCPACGATYLVEGELCKAAPQADAPPEPIPLVDLRAEHAPLMPALVKAFERVVYSGQLILGEEVRAFEQEAAAALGVPHAVGVSSGSDALLVSLLALGIGPGDEVVTTAYSFFSTAGSVARTGATPVFADIDLDTFNLDPKGLAAAITPRTRAIVAVHLFGRPCDMRAVTRIAARHNLYVVEDAAQAIGARAADGPVGGLGDVGCFSFFPTKNLGALGDGGLVTSHSEAIADRVRLLRTHGARPKNVHVELGGNFRLDALQAALLREKLPHVERWTAARRRNAELYGQIFASAALDPGDLAYPRELPEGHVFHQYVIRTPRRDALRTHLARRGIATEVYYPVPLPLQPVFAPMGHREGSFPAAERASREALSLPIFPELGEARVTRVAKEIVTFLRA
jgi:dTDP-4-amino-4,6-dideoxygalactose transaminase/acetyltransferase-like isoleucine patch superfamily enzyme